MKKITSAIINRIVGLIRFNRLVKLLIITCVWIIFPAPIDITLADSLRGL